MPSIGESKQHFQFKVLPRRVRDPNAEQVYYKKHGASKRIYRRVLPNETDRGEPYPCLSSGISLLAHFGLGVGVYYMQLLIQAIVFVIGGLVLIPLFLSYAGDVYSSPTTDPRLYASGTCTESRLVNATLGCEDGVSFCEAYYRERCELSQNAVMADILMSLIIALLLLLGKIPEKELLEKLDEAVQTLQDYSVVVNNPPADANDPDEWKDFFSRFGTVRLVTIAKSNSSLCYLLLKKHDAMERLSHFEKEETGTTGSNILTAIGLLSNAEQEKKKLRKLEAKIAEASRENYNVVRIFVSFDLEEHQRLCLRELEVPNIELFYRNANREGRLKFRKEYVLDVEESQEFDNIHWQNLELGSTMRAINRSVALLWTLLVLLAVYFLVSWIHSDYLQLLPIIVALVDMTMPVIFNSITNFECANDEDDRQDSLLVKLFLARFLITIIFPYIFSTWNEFLDSAHVETIVYTQLAACFISPLIAATDVVGLIRRNVLSPILSQTQTEMNRHWQGTEWTLAERYTNLAKIVFLAIFYSLITPISIFIGAVAFALIFFVDRYLLLRCWKPPKMLDATMAFRVRQITLLAVAAHLYATSRFVYSWPMDQAYISTIFDGTNTTAVFTKIDKNPPYNILEIEVQSWHSSGQSATVVVYKWVAVVMIIVCGYSIFAASLVDFFTNLFFSKESLSGDVVGIPFFAVSKIGCYCPSIERDGESFICADTSMALEEFLPSKPDSIDLTLLVPEVHRKYVMSIVKWYGLEKHGKFGDLLASLKDDHSALHSDNINNVSGEQTKDQLPQINRSKSKSSDYNYVAVPVKKVLPFEKMLSLEFDLVPTINLKRKPSTEREDINLHHFDSLIDIHARKVLFDEPKRSTTLSKKTRKVRKKQQMLPTVELAPVVIRKL